MPKFTPLNNRRAVWINDTSLRDGLQSPDIVLSYSNRLFLARLLAETGVNELEAGIPAVGNDEITSIRTIACECPSVTVTSWCRAKTFDIDAAARCETGSIHISFPLSLQYRSLLSMSIDDVLSQCRTLLKKAAHNFSRISVGIQDATRTSIDDIAAFIAVAQENGANHIRLADTIGIADPLLIHEIITTLCDRIPGVKLELHAHNDLGMATANAVTAAQSGAHALSVTINGIGERTGNAPLEEVAVALHRSTQLTSSIRLKTLYQTSTLAAKLCKRSIPPNKPVTGSKAFTHQSGIHCYGLSQQHNSFEPYTPESIGRIGNTIVAGPYSGRSTIQLMLAQNGYTVTVQQATSLLPIVRQEALRRNKVLTSEEVTALYFNKFGLR
jgi:homocitrate synthase NifV